MEDRRDERDLEREEPDLDLDLDPNIYTSYEHLNDIFTKVKPSLPLREPDLERLRDLEPECDLERDRDLDEREADLEREPDFDREDGDLERDLDAERLLESFLGEGEREVSSFLVLSKTLKQIIKVNHNHSSLQTTLPSLFKRLAGDSTSLLLCSFETETLLSLSCGFPRFPKESASMLGSALMSSGSSIL